MGLWLSCCSVYFAFFYFVVRRCRDGKCRRGREEPTGRKVIHLSVITDGCLAVVGLHHLHNTAMVGEGFACFGASFFQCWFWMEIWTRETEIKIEGPG